VPERIFVDTVFVIALINRRDQYHAVASELADQVEGLPLLITDAILLEIGNALSANFRAEAAEIIEHFLAAEEVKVARLTPQIFDRALEMYKKYHDKEWSLVDCVSFTVMREAEITRALTFDQHFIQAGFEALMR